MNDPVDEAEEAISQGMIDGTLGNGRLLDALWALDHGHWMVPLTSLRQALGHFHGRPVREALLIALRELRVQGRLHVADLQLLAIGIYRLVWRLLVRLDPTVRLDDVRGLDAASAASLCYGFTFGLHPRPFPVPASVGERISERLGPLIAAKEMDHDWHQDTPLPLAVPFVTVSDRRLTPAANGIRNLFHARVFLDTLAGGHPAGLEDDALVLDFLLHAGADPRLVPGFDQIDRAQSRFRLAQLTLVLIAIHQTEAAGQEDVIPFHQAATACLLSPLASLRGWVRANQDDLLIPVIRHRPGVEPHLHAYRPAITARRTPTPLLVPALH